MLSVLIALHLLVAISLIGFILIQRGRGADIGAAFGSGASQTVFGSQGSASFLTRITAVLATLFFVSSLGLAYVYSQQVERTSVTDTALQAESAAPPPASGAGAQGAQEQGEPVDVPEVPESPSSPPENVSQQ